MNVDEFLRQPDTTQSYPVLTKWDEGTLVAIKTLYSHDNKPLSDKPHEVYEIVSAHPEGLVLKNENGVLYAVTRKAFESREPFPAGHVELVSRWWWPFAGWEKRVWRFTQRKPRFAGDEETSSMAWKATPEHERALREFKKRAEAAMIEDLNGQ